MPFIASWPEGGLSGGRRTDALIGLIDLFATVAGVLGVSLPEAALDSLDVMPSLREGSPVRSEIVVASGPGARGLRSGDWIYLEPGGVRQEPIWYLEKFGIEPVDSPAMLFNLREDLGQKYNLALEYPERVDTLKQRLEAIFNRP